MPRRSFIDILAMINSSEGADSPTFLLIATIYKRLLGIFNALMSAIMSSLNTFSQQSSSLASSNSLGSGSLQDTALPNRANRLFLGLGIQLAGLDVMNHNNLQLRTLVEACTYMLDRIDGVLRGPGQNAANKAQPLQGSAQLGGRWGSVAGPETPPPRPSIMDVVAIVVRHDDMLSRESGKRPISLLNGTVQTLNQLLRTV